MVKHSTYNTHRNHLAFIVLVITLVIVSLSCGILSGEEETDESKKETDIALGIQQTMDAREQDPAPTQPADPPTQPPAKQPSSPTEETQPEATAVLEEAAGGQINPNASQPGDIYYLESFEIMEGWWVFPMRGDENGFGYELFDGRLRAEIVSQDTWVYYIFEGGGNFQDIRIDITVENRASNTNFVGIICRSSDRGWYEANILNTGEYFVYYGGSSGLEGTMHKGASTLIKTGRSVNSYALTCIQDQLMVEINGIEVVTIPLKTGDFRFLDDGQIGLSVSTSYAIPVVVDFLEITLSVP